MILSTASILRLLRQYIKLGVTNVRSDNPIGRILESYSLARRAELSPNSGLWGKLECSNIGSLIYLGLHSQVASELDIILGYDSDLSQLTESDIYFLEELQRLLNIWYNVVYGDEHGR